jgi:hypothetical protein
MAFSLAQYFGKKEQSCKFSTWKYSLIPYYSLRWAKVCFIYVMHRDSQQDLYNLLGATYAAIFFIGATNCMSVQPVVSIERAVYYRESAAGMYSPLSYAFAQVTSHACLYLSAILNEI